MIPSVFKFRDKEIHTVLSYLLVQWIKRSATGKSQNHGKWEDGDELKFKIDTNENTIVFQKGDTSC